MTEPVNTMRAEILSEWLRRLRSGDYQQGTGSLRRSGTHCCLGVLCDIAVDQGYGSWREDDASDFYLLPGHTVEAGQGEESLPPNELLLWAGVTLASDSQQGQSLGVMASGPPDGHEVSAKLHQLNDGDCGFKRQTFLEIADLIETQFTPIP